MHLELVRFRQNRHGRSRGMYTSLRLRHRYTLHTVNAALVLERTIHILTGHIENNLLVSACRTFGERRHGVLKSLDLKVLAVHTEQVSGKNSRLVTSRTATDLHHHVLTVFRILRQQLQLQLFLQLRNLRFQLIDLRLRHLFHLRIGLVVEQILRILQVRHRFLIPMSALQHTFQVMVIAIQTHIACLVSNHRRIGNE